MTDTSPRPPNPPKGKVSHVVLRRDSFKRGPVFIDEADTYVTFAESVDVDFSNVEHDDASPMHLGFFGALIVRAPRVVVDLRGHTLRMRDSYRARQRFFACVELCNTPLPSGKAGFKTNAVANDDLVVRNGTIGATSHHCIHALKAGERWLFEDLVLKDYEVGAISVNEASDLEVRRVKIGAPLAPTTSADQVMVRDLARTCERVGKPDLARAVRDIPVMAAPRRSDALVRCLVIQPKFNVGRPKPAHGAERIARIRISDVAFASVRAHPVEVVGIRGHDGLPLKDLNGNVIAHADAVAGSLLARTQALVSPDLPRSVRHALMSGPYRSAPPVHGFDRRGHDLVMKASLYVRVDGCDGVTLRNLRCGSVTSTGKHSSAVGVMLNDCTRCALSSMIIDGVHVDDPDASPLSDERPQSGLCIRASKGVAVTGYSYKSADGASACALNDVAHIAMRGCAFSGAPFSAKKVSGLSLNPL